MKLLFATDIHLRATAPVSRLDEDFFATQLGKIDSVRRIAAERKPDLVLLGGDIFDAPAPPPSVQIKAIRAFKAFGQNVYTVCGNHDIYGYSDTTLSTSALGVMFESGALHKLGELYRPGVYIKGLHAYDKTDWNTDSSKHNDRHCEDAKIVDVIVAHKMLSTMPLPGQDNYLVSKVDAETNAGLILSGDIHTPFCVKTDSGRWFVNPGSLTRMSVNDRHRRPQVALITISGYDVTVELIDVESKPGSEVFDEAAYEERIAGEAHTKQFVRDYVGEIVGAKGKVAEIGPALLSYAAAQAASNPDVTRVLTSALGRAEKAVLRESEE